MTGTVEKSDPFALLGVPRRFAIAPDELERCFHERSRAVHPDRFARAAPAERRAALERATRLNDAYATLRDPWRRAACLLELLEASDAPAAGTETGFLEEQLVAREELARARRRHDRAAVEALRRRAVEACAALEREVALLLGPEAPDATAVGEARRALAQARFHRALIAEAERALDERAPPPRKATP